MPTPKQVRECYKRLHYHSWQLQKALDHAHNLEVIQYDSSKYTEEAPCRAMFELRERIDATTAKARAKALKDEVMRELKNAW